MTYEEFILTVKKAGVDVSPYIPFDVDSVSIYRDDVIARKKYKTNFIIQYWETGGSRGGDCWGGESREYISGTVAPASFDALDTILEHIRPDITLLQYKKLCKDVMRTGSETHYEYYGNYKCYDYRLVLLETLYKYLFEKA